jgi:hypothetical protein
MHRYSQGIHLKLPVNSAYIHADDLFGTVEKKLFPIIDKKVGKSVILCEYLLHINNLATNT